MIMGIKLTNTSSQIQDYLNDNYYFEEDKYLSENPEVKVLKEFDY